MNLCFSEKNVYISSSPFSYQAKTKFTVPCRAQVQSMATQSHLSIAIKGKVEEDDESIIGGTDVAALVRKVPSEPNLQRAVRMIDIVMDRNIKISINTFSSLIQRCGQERDLIAGKKVHEQLLENNYKANVLLANMLIDMYGRCGSVEDAQQVFDEMSIHNIYSWTTLISAYANKGMVQEAICVLKGMQNAGNRPDGLVLVVLLQSCGRNGNLKEGKWLHHQVRRNGLASDLTVGNAVIDMYAKCGSLELAQEVFNGLPEYNAESWAALIAGFVCATREGAAFKLYEQMQKQSIEPNEAIYVSILEACANIIDVQRGETIHAHSIQSDCESSLIVSSALVDMYVNCGDLLQALVIFNKMYERDIYAWNSLLIGHVHQGLDECAVSLYQQLRGGLEMPDAVTFAVVMDACSNLGVLNMGREVYTEVMKHGYDNDTNIGDLITHWLHLYA